MPLETCKDPDKAKILSLPRISRRLAASRDWKQILPKMMTFASRLHLAGGFLIGFPMLECTLWITSRDEHNIGSIGPINNLIDKMSGRCNRAAIWATHVEIGRKEMECWQTNLQSCQNKPQPSIMGMTVARQISAALDSTPIKPFAPLLHR